MKNYVLPNETIIEVISINKTTKEVGNKNYSYTAFQKGFSSF
jgi:ABC-type antimicrobial peptide transport system permease subunit